MWFLAFLQYIQSCLLCQAKTIRRFFASDKQQHHICCSIMYQVLQVEALERTQIKQFFYILTGLYC